MDILVDLILFFIRLYILLITIKIFLSWLNLPINRFTHYLSLAVDPLLNYFKRTLPLRIGFLDLSPIVPLLLLSLTDSVIVDIFKSGQAFGISFILRKVLFLLRYGLSVFFFIFTFSCIILLVMSFFNRNTYNPMVTMMRSFLDPIMSRLRRIIKIHSFYSDRIYLVILIVLSFITSSALNFLIQYTDFILLTRMKF